MLSRERKYTSEEHFDIVTVQRILEILHFITPFTLLNSDYIKDFKN